MQEVILLKGGNKYKEGRCKGQLKKSIHWNCFNLSVKTREKHVILINNNTKNLYTIISEALKSICKNEPIWLRKQWVIVVVGVKNRGFSAFKGPLQDLQALRPIFSILYAGTSVLFFPPITFIYLYSY